MTHYDQRLTPTLTVAISGRSAVIAYDGDLELAARLSIVDLPALRAALDRWEDALLAGEVGAGRDTTALTEACKPFWRGDGWTGK